MKNKKPSCFAYRPGGCKILVDTYDCSDCKFFKNKDKFNSDLAKARERVEERFWEGFDYQAYYNAKHKEQDE